MTSPPAERRHSVDAMRVVAAFGIVWAHMQAPGMGEGYVALSLFATLTAFLSLRSYERGGARRFWLGRLVRFLLPWLAWSGAFLLVAAARDGGWRAVVEAEAGRFWPLIGPSLHLWFLPFVLLASPLVPLASRALTDETRLWAASALLAPLALGALWLHDRAGLPAPWAQWAFALMPTLYGLLSAAGHRVGSLHGPLAFAALAGLGSALGWGSLAGPALLGSCLLFEGVWRLRVRGAALPALGALAFGVYLVHPVFMLAWFRLAPDAPAALGAVAVFAASLLAAAAIRRLPYGRLLA